MIDPFENLPPDPKQQHDIRYRILHGVVAAMLEGFSTDAARFEYPDFFNLRGVPSVAYASNDAIIEIVSNWRSRLLDADGTHALRFIIKAGDDHIIADSGIHETVVNIPPMAFDFNDGGESDPVAWANSVVNVWLGIIQEEIDSVDGTADE